MPHDYDFDALAKTLTDALAAVGSSLDVAAAHVLVTRALLELLDERGILLAADVRDRALDLVQQDSTLSPDLAGVIERMLPDPAARPIAGALAAAKH